MKKIDGSQRNLCSLPGRKDNQEQGFEEGSKSMRLVEISAIKKGNAFAYQLIR